MRSGSACCCTCRPRNRIRGIRRTTIAPLSTAFCGSTAALRALAENGWMGYNPIRKQAFLAINYSAPGTAMYDLITLELLRQIILDWASAMEANADYLTQLDVPIGDGDHGRNMALG